MKKASAIYCAIAGLSICGTQAGFAQTIAEPELVFHSAAMRSTDVSGYLRTMQSIMKKYTDCVFSLVTTNGIAPPSGETMSAASRQTSAVAAEIAAVNAPEEIAAQHKQLATTMQSVDRFLKSHNGAGVEALPEALGLIGSVQSTMTQYHGATQTLIAKYGLPEALDPMGGDMQNSFKQQQLTGLMQGFQGNLAPGALGGALGEPVVGGIGGAGGLSGTGGTGLGALQGLDLSKIDLSKIDLSKLGGANGINLDELGKSLQLTPTGAGAGTPTGTGLKAPAPKPAELEGMQTDGGTEGTDTVDSLLKE